MVQTGLRQPSTMIMYDKLASIGNNIFASAGGLSVPGLFLSTDYGASWSNVGPLLSGFSHKWNKPFWSARWFNCISYNR